MTANELDLTYDRSTCTHVETTRNLVSTGTIVRDKAAKLRAIMEREFPDAEVRGYEHLVATMPNDEKEICSTSMEMRSSSCSGNKRQTLPDRRSRSRNYSIDLHGCRRNS